MKRLLLCLLLLLMSNPAHAETETRTGRVREDMPLLTVNVTQDDSFDEDSLRPYTLTAHITAADGSLTQEIVWRSNETPNRERAAAGCWSGRTTPPSDCPRAALTWFRMRSSTA